MLSNTQTSGDDSKGQAAQEQMKEISSVEDEMAVSGMVSPVIGQPVHNDDEELMEAVQRIQRQAALTAAVNPWCYPSTSSLPASLIFGLQGTDHCSIG